jgi:sigma-B regulation protein RsbU (phosphoserine phosphatase)
MVVSAPADTDEIHQLGPAADSDATLFPEWIWAKSDWSGLAFLPPPEGSNTAFGSPSFRAFVHGKAHETPFIVLVIVPVNRAFISQVTKTTGIDVRPFFLGAKSAGVKRGSHSVTIGDENMKQTEETEREWESKGEMGSNGKFELDQLGRPMSAAFPILLNSTNWLTGDQSERLAFMFGWSWAEAQKHLLEGGTLGDLFRKILIAVGIGFLVLEVLALLSAGWMTRAVTGTVHKLYRATRYINRGDFSHRVRVRSHDQLGELAGAFNEMSSNIETLLKERVERERLQREVEIAAEVQAQLFPAEVPKLSTVGLSGECRAARGVAGDYYDYVEIEPGLVTIALGDVSGKGISASLVMSNLQASVRAQSSMIAERVRAGREFTVSAVAASGEGTSTFHLPMTNHDCSVGKIASSINHQLCGSTGANRFATLFIGIYDDHTRTMSYTNAGHNAPMLVRAGGTIERLAVGGMMVGAFDWAKYDEAVIRLNPDDLLLVFSDGITEAERATGEEFSEERLAQFVLKNRHLSTKDLCEAIFHEIEAWSGTAERADDQTLVIMKAAA